MVRFIVSFLFLATLSLSSSEARAQQQGVPACEGCRYGISFIGGQSRYDLAGTGRSSVVGLHVDRAITQWLMADLSVRFMRPEVQSGNRALYKIPELQLQAQWPTGSFRPYLGVGGGWFMRGGGRRSEGTLGSAIGVRYIGRMIPFGARVELRVRGIGESFNGSAVEQTVGATLRF